MKGKIIALAITLIVVIIIGVLTGTGAINKIFNKDVVSKIETEVKSNTEEAKQTRIVKGLDSNNNVIWTYETKEVYVAQYENLEYFGENNKKVYLNEEGTIIALDKNTGKVLWKNDEYKASGSIYTFDKDGILYLAAPTSPSLFAVDKNGKTFVRISEIDPEYLYWPSEIKIIDDNNLTLCYPKEFDGMEYTAKIIFSLEEMKNKDNKILEKEIECKYSNMRIYGFENIEKFNLNKNGEVILTYKDNKGSTKIADNVKNIKLLFEGNGGFGSLVMVKKDGSILTLKSEDIYMNNETKVKQLDINNVIYTIIYEGFEGEGYLVVTTDEKVLYTYDIGIKE